MNDQRYDIVFRGDGTPRIEPHHCREWDDDGGCYGTNMNHGLALNEAVKELIAWHRDQTEQLESGVHWQIEQYTDADDA